MDKRVKALRAEIFVKALELEIAERGAEVPWDLDYEVLFGVLLKTVREFRGMSQAKLARASGITKSAINELEAGHHMPQRKTIRKLAKGLRVPEQQLDPHAVFRYLPAQPESVIKRLREADRQEEE